ncbi:hypothetical protein PF011_g9463, partial [Phytophthora fragariae]
TPPSLPPAAAPLPPSHSLDATLPSLRLSSSSSPARSSQLTRSSRPARAPLPRASPTAGSLLRALELVGHRVDRAATLHTGHIELSDAEVQTDDEAVGYLNRRAAQIERDPEKLAQYLFDAASARMQTRLSEHPLLLVERPFALPEEDIVLPRYFDRQLT